MPPTKTITCSTGEVVKGYNNYLRTKHWQLLRIRIAELHNYTCLRCDGIFKQGFHIHHITYKRLGNELDRDLGFYCSSCHKILHGKRKSKRAFNKQYANLITSKMHEFNDNQIEIVLDFIDYVSKEVNTDQSEEYVTTFMNKTYRSR